MTSSFFRHGWPLGAACLALAGCPSGGGSDDGTLTTTPMTSTTITTGGPDETTSGSTGGPGATSMVTTGATTEPATGSSGGTAGSASSGAVDSSSDGGSQVCGNNVIEGDEVCDLAQLNGETCESLGYQGGTLGCLLTCEDYNLLGCFICGNDVIDMAEDCEPGLGIPDGVDCESMGFEGGNLGCDPASCVWDTSDCSICGDGVQQGFEQCDGIDLGGQDCMSIGFDMGTLGCNIATCTYDVTACSGGMYFQDFEAGVIPPEFTLGGNQVFAIDNTNQINGTFTAASGPITHNQSSTIALTANFAAAGDIVFMYKTSTEGSFDYLEFWVDGVMVTEWSGTNGPAMFTHPVAAGTHDIEWRYTKDGSVNAGADKVWIDDIQLSPGVPI